MVGTMPEKLTSQEALRQAGPRCFVRQHAPTVYAIITDDYVFPACGDHLTSAIKAIAEQSGPEVDSVTVYWRV